MRLAYRKHMKESRQADLDDKIIDLPHKMSCDHWAEYQKQKLHEEGQGAQMREYSISRSVVMAAVHGILIAYNHTLSGIWRARFSIGHIICYTK